MAVVARELVQEMAHPPAIDPLLQLHLVEIPAPAAERAWPAWIIGGSIIGTLAGLLYVVAAAA